MFMMNSVLFLINDRPLSGITDFEIIVENKKVYVEATRSVEDDELINEMLLAPFSFKIMNTTNNSGYIGHVANLIKLRIVANKDQTNLVQYLKIEMPSIGFEKDLRSPMLIATEIEDYKNLISVIKQNQKKEHCVIPEPLKASKQKIKK